MTLYHPSNPESANQFRDNTAKLATMAGVTGIPKLAYCPNCERRRTELTGEWREGVFCCARCAGK